MSGTSGLKVRDVYAETSRDSVKTFVSTEVQYTRQATYIGVSWSERAIFPVWAA